MLLARLVNANLVGISVFTDKKGQNLISNVCKDQLLGSYSGLHTEKLKNRNCADEFELICHSHSHPRPNKEKMFFC